MKYKTTKPFILSALKQLDNDKREQLEKALNRNLYFTSARVLSLATMKVYKQGWHIKLDGTKCSFSVWFTDNDGELIAERKPNENKLDFLYEDTAMMNEADFI